MFLVNFIFCRTLSSDYSLKRHRTTCAEVKAAAKAASGT